MLVLEYCTIIDGQKKGDIAMNHLKITVNPSKQTAKGRMRMYQPAQKPASGQPMKRSPRNQRNDQMGLPPPEPSPPPAAIFSAVRKLEFM